MELPDSVRAAISEAFGSGRQREVAMMLPGFEQLALKPPYERVLLAIVGLADGSLDGVAQYSRAAIADWRDVLFWWETPTEASQPATRTGTMIDTLEDADD